MQDHEIIFDLASSPTKMGVRSFCCFGHFCIRFVRFCTSIFIFYMSTLNCKLFSI